MTSAHGEAPVGRTVEWYTPPYIFEHLDLEFDLDPASPGAAAVPWIPATVHYTLADDGLRRPWFGRVWLNPPYGPPALAFLQRLVDHREGIALVYARTDTAWWHAAAPHATQVCFLRDRVSFIRADGFDGRPPMGSALLAFGGACANAVRASGLGWCP